MQKGNADFEKFPKKSQSIAPRAKGFGHSPETDLWSADVWNLVKSEFPAFGKTEAKFFENATVLADLVKRFFGIFAFSLPAKNDQNARLLIAIVAETVYFSGF